jgi:cob(I)alamin adenosyltransferase
MKLYTRSGDDGTTGLFGGDRVKKDHPRIDACGHVDELNACIGWILALITDASPTAPKPGHSAAPPRVAPASAFNSTSASILTTIQSRLFDLGADLATPLNSKHESKVKRISDEHVGQAERWIDEVDASNSPITVFILPGGTELAARLHLARTVCRRAERAMVHLSQSETINPQALIFINRISDLLFAMARWANREAGVPDVAWRQ